MSITLTEQTAPATPSSGKVVLYPLADGLLYQKDDAGTVTQVGAPGILAAVQDSVTDTAACSVTNYFSTLTTTTTATPTLADGIEGQLKKIQMIVDAGDATLTPTNLTGGNTITFADVGDVAELKFSSGSWVAIALYNIVDGSTAPVLA